MKKKECQAEIPEFAEWDECLFFEKYKPSEAEEKTARVFHGKQKALRVKRPRRFDFFRRVSGLVRTRL